MISGIYSHHHTLLTQVQRQEQEVLGSGLMFISELWIEIDHLKGEGLQEEEEDERRLNLSILLD